MGYYYINRIIQNEFINNKLLILSDILNNSLKLLLRKSYRLRMHCYGEGLLRLSNDRDISLYYRWPESGDISWLITPSFVLDAIEMFDEKDVLEIACANGWYYREIYSCIERLNYTGFDICNDTVMEARRKLKWKTEDKKRKLNAQFIVDDAITTTLYEKDYTHVLWFSSICMFRQQDRESIMKKIAACLKKKNGIFCGSVFLKNETDYKWSYWIEEYNDQYELKVELGKHFKNVFVKKQTAQMLFMASDGNLPYYNKDVTQY